MLSFGVKTCIVGYPIAVVELAAEGELEILPCVSRW